MSLPQSRTSHPSGLGGRSSLPVPSPRLYCTRNMTAAVRSCLGPAGSQVSPSDEDKANTADPLAILPRNPASARVCFWVGLNDSRRGWQRTASAPPIGCERPRFHLASESEHDGGTSWVRGVGVCCSYVVAPSWCCCVDDAAAIGRLGPWIWKHIDHSPSRVRQRKTGGASVTVIAIGFHVSFRRSLVTVQGIGSPVPKELKQATPVLNPGGRTTPHTRDQTRGE